LTRAREELKAQHEFDAVVINDNLESALNQVETLMGLG
jgi:guanylate kinase